MKQDVPLTRDLVLIGGGHTHALVLRRWGMQPLPGVRLTLIDPGATTAYTGMLPGFVAGHYSREELDIDLVRLARFAGARFIEGRATAIDRVSKTIAVEGRPPVTYDVASVDVGASSRLSEIPGFDGFAIPAKPLQNFASRWSTFRESDKEARVVVIGGGVGGVELALAMAHAMKAAGRRHHVTIFETDALLRGVGARARQALLTRLERSGIVCHEQTAVHRIESDAVFLDRDRSLPANFVVGAAGVVAWPWLAGTGLETTDGFLTVDRELRTSDPSIFAAGDCAHLAFAPRPKAGVFAVRAAPIVDANLRAALSSRPMRRFRPQSRYLKLISLGAKDALFEKWGLSFDGPRIWAMKDRIDRKFMDRVSDLEPMSPHMPAGVVAAGVCAEMNNGAPFCAGCGAKAGKSVLAATFPPEGPHREIWEDAAVFAVGKEQVVASTDHLPAMIEDPFLFGKIATEHALGDIWSMAARPTHAFCNVILPRQSEALQARAIKEILAGVREVLGCAGARLEGGHTTLGDTLTLGLTILGTPRARPVRQTSAQAGDVILLTRPIGSGTLLAGDMALLAKGQDISALLGELAKSQRKASAALVDAHAMTDVTGFGLAGHLLNILDASSVGAELQIAEVPLFSGALDLAQRGVRSSLYQSNKDACGDRVVLKEHPAEPLLFDPQTSGGLLATVDAEMADVICEALRQSGHLAARIGLIVDGPPRILVT